MKVIWKVALILIIVLAFFYIRDNRVQENNLLESPVMHGSPIPADEVVEGSVIPRTSRPQTGLSKYVGKSTESVVKEFGQPDRVEPSGYNYDWWIFSNRHHFMIGVKNEKVNQIYTADIGLDVSPFSIGQDIKEIYRYTIVESEVSVSVDENVYAFTLNSEDMKNRLLIQYDNLYVQLYVDGTDDSLEAVRFIDPITLVLHQPYDMSFLGEIVTENRPSSSMQMEVDRAMERQIFEITNMYRKKNGLNELTFDYSLQSLAQIHSKDMAFVKYFQSDPASIKSLSDRLNAAEIEHKKAGENIAYNYVDAIEVVHGWLNSPAHRGVLLDKNFTHLGTGVFGRYYTQDLIKMPISVEIN